MFTMPVGTFCRLAAVAALVALSSTLASSAARAQGGSDKVGGCEHLVVSQQDAAHSAARPFSLDLQNGRGTRLVYVGVRRHTFDPADSQFVAIQSAWQMLKPTLVFYEGTETLVGDSTADAIRRGGEPGLVRYLAARSGVPARSLEPSRAGEIEALRRQFSAEQLALFFAIRPVVEQRDRRHLQGPVLDSLLEQSLGRVNHLAGISGVPPDLAALRAAYSRWFPGMSPTGAPAQWFNPLRTSAETGSRFFNDVNRASSMFRDTYMYRLIATAGQTPQARIFAQVGRDHIPSQAAALRCALAG